MSFVRRPVWEGLPGRPDEAWSTPRASIKLLAPPCSEGERGTRLVGRVFRTDAARQPEVVSRGRASWPSKRQSRGPSWVSPPWPCRPGFPPGAARTLVELYAEKGDRKHERQGGPAVRVPRLRRRRRVRSPLRVACLSWRRRGPRRLRTGLDPTVEVTSSTKASVVAQTGMDTAKEEAGQHGRELLEHLEDWVRSRTASSCPRNTKSRRGWGHGPSRRRK